VNAVDLLNYFAAPILFILLCMAVVRWAGAKRCIVSWMTQAIHSLDGFSFLLAAAKKEKD
jgi:hypothetical protein